MTTVLIVPGSALWASLFEETQTALCQTLHLPQDAVEIVPTTVLDWIGFPPTPERSTNRVMKLIDQTLRLLVSRYPEAPVTIVGHSGGGTAAMIFLLGKSFQGDCYSDAPGIGAVKTLLTLGSPYHNVDRYGKEKSDFIFTHLSPDFLERVRVVSVASNSVSGKADGTLIERAAHFCYAQVTGKDEVKNMAGDGVVPTESCRLDGATNVVIEKSERIEHLPSPPFFPLNRWYGSKNGVALWHALIERKEKC